MENKARYTLVGLFIVLFGTALVLFVLWQARFSLDKNDMHEYRIYSKNSVAGLKPNSFVEYKGLTVGTIRSIDIDPKNSEQIEIILDIYNPKIIKQDSYASINSLGITGNKHIEIDGGTDAAPVVLPPQNGYATIPLEESFFDTLTTEAGDITKNLNITLNSINTLLNQKNIEHINTILQNLRDTTQKLDPTLNQINTTFAHVDKTLLDVQTVLQNEAKNTLGGIDNFTNEWTVLAKEIRVVLEKDLQKLLNNLDQTVQSSTGIQEVISGVNNTLGKIDDTLDTLSENGGDMLFKTRDVRYGPQEQIDE